MQDSFSSLIKKALRKKCPRCGEGFLFRGWYDLLEKCPVCNLVYEPSAGDTWGFMYVTTAGITGVIILGMFLIHPQNILLGQMITGLIAVVAIIGTLPYRKSIAISLDWLTRREK